MNNQLSKYNNFVSLREMYLCNEYFVSICTSSMYIFASSFEY